VQKLVYPPIPKYFNTAGPCLPRRHYMLPPLPRVPEARALVERGGYFVLQVPRLSGRTTFLMAFAQALTEGGQYAALYTSCEVGEASGDDAAAAQRAIVQTMVAFASDQLPPELRPPSMPELDDETRLASVLRVWSEACPRRLVVFFDEIDALRGQSLISVLRQLRAGFPKRPDHAPWSVVLCGLRDVREYRAASGGDGERLGTASPFNVKVKSLSLDTLTPAQVTELLLQHTAETGQPFEPEALARVAELSGGHPWLVNALAREVVDELKVKGPITAAHVDEGKERLVLARATHLDSLVHTLTQDRVRRVVAPMLSGEQPDPDPVFNDDVSYVVDLGLVRPNPLRIANPIYTEVIARVLSNPVQQLVFADPRTFVRADGRFDLDVLLREFAAFWVEQGESLVDRTSYAEAGAQLVLMAFLQRVVNGGGVVTREYGLGRRRVDLLLTWPWTDAQGKRQVQRDAIELKVWRTGRKDPLAEGLVQLDGYLERLGLSDGVLMIFDRRVPAPPLEERVREELAVTATGKRVRVWRG
jgi:hypothetical protein